MAKRAAQKQTELSVNKFTLKQNLRAFNMQNNHRYEFSNKGHEKSKGRKYDGL